MKNTMPTSVRQSAPLRGTVSLQGIARTGFAVVALAAAFAVPAPALAQNAAVVNGKPISKARVDEFMQALAAQGRPDTPETRNLVREELIAREIFSQEADKKGLARTDDVKRQLENTRQDILIRALIRDHLTKNPITDADVKGEYDKFVAQTASSGKEYKARHILVESEDEAKKLLDQLKKGGKFDELAKQSKDPGSGANGGDLGWNTAETFVKEFSDAMVALNKGDTTAAPIKSQFGFHIIRLDDVRDAAPPPMDQVRPQIQQQLERQKIQDLQQKLRTAAKVE